MTTGEPIKIKLVSGVGPRNDVVVLLKVLNILLNSGVTYCRRIIYNTVEKEKFLGASRNHQFPGGLMNVNQNQ